jgi:hypothetical protein
MSRRLISQIAFRAIRIEGGLIPAEELTRLTTLQNPEKTEQTDSQYGVPKGLKLRDEIGRFWKISQNLWLDFQSRRVRQDVDAHQVVVHEFIVPLLRTVFGFSDLTETGGIEASGHTYNVGFTAKGGHLPVILAAFDEAMDTAAERFGEYNEETGKTRRRSPFMLAQEALNASDNSLWAITCNGLSLRILRDNPSLTRPAYLEIDLETLFTEELYSDFTAFWLLAHASRFGAAKAEPEDCTWERWRNAGQEAGVTVRSNLRYQVAEALRALGTGFLSHPLNGALRAKLQSEGGESLGKQAFYEELLRLIYRLIFLATVEDRTDPSSGRPLIFTPDASKEAQRRYMVGYSITWLRERAVRRSSHDMHGDLWQALSVCFDSLAHGESALGLPALGGLFDRGQCPNLLGAHIENRWLLGAIYQLGYFRQVVGLSRVNYRDMGPEELGSVYESLLELVPDVQNLAQPHAARLAFVGDDDTEGSTRGNSRKLTGSYYTPDSLVQELIKSALEPVIAETVRANPERPVQALLELTICDPACGSGHFLLAAARRLADEVAKLRAPNGAPTPVDYRHALRDVVSHCIYGVDRNPMAIALAKTALWLEAYTPDKPLTFIDHHLQVGDALLGVLDPTILERGIPDEAYAVLTGDDKTTAAELRKKNKADLKSWRNVETGNLFSASQLATHANVVECLDDGTLGSISKKRDAWMAAAEKANSSMLAKLADTYVAAFLAPKLPGELAIVPLSGYLWGLLNPIPGQVANEALAQSVYHLCRRNSVFHWWIAFPHVAAMGGFSVVLGNPPWEVSQLGEEEFFAIRAPSVAALSGEKRKQAIALLENTTPWLWHEFKDTKRGYEAVNLFFRSSGRYPLSAVGKINTYRLFAESISQLISSLGRAGFIVPTGIATDDTAKDYFANVAQGGRLVSLYDFENSAPIFASVHRSFKFSLLTLGLSQKADFVCFATHTSHLLDARRRFQLTKDEFRLINPNTRTCPIFRSQRDAELTKKLYRAAPVLIKEGCSDESVQDINPWGIHFSQGLFNMTSDSGLFHDSPDASDNAVRLPLYEAKMIHQFDHRWATYIDALDKPNGLDTKDVTDLQKSDAEFVVRPRYWVDETQVLSRIARVPSRVAGAWLAWRSASVGKQRSETESALQFALASWVAGELFRREAGLPVQVPSTTQMAWSVATASKAIAIAEKWLAVRFPNFLKILKENDVSGKKQLAAFAKWAFQDAPGQRLNLDDGSLTELAVHQNRLPMNFGFLDEWMDSRSPKWLMGWRDICRSTDERTVIAATLPRLAVGNKIPLFFPLPQIEPGQSAALIANLSSLTLDFVARQKLGGVTLNYFYFKQFPVFGPQRYSELDLKFIVSRVLELTFTTKEIAPWAATLREFDRRPTEKHPEPFSWNPSRRAQVRAELDAYFALLYGLTREELRYILDPTDVMGDDYPSETFRGLKNNEMSAYGEYRTQRLVLEAWDKLSQGAIS